MAGKKEKIPFSVGLALISVGLALISVKNVNSVLKRDPFIKPWFKPSRGISHSLSAPPAPLRSNRITDLFPHFRSEIVILHSAAAPFRTTNS